MELTTFFTDDHRRCDLLWADVEATADRGGDLSEALERFGDALLRHLAMEEEVLFPAFDARTGMSMGPTQVMRTEHTQMRGVLAMMQAAVSEPQSVLDHGDTLLMLTQQHNAKEEHMLYPMAAEFLPDQWPGLYAELSRRGESPVDPRGWRGPTG